MASEQRAFPKRQLVRVTDFPTADSETAKGLLRGMIEQQIQGQVGYNGVFTVTMVPSCAGDNLVGLVEFNRGLPEFLSSIDDDPLGMHQQEIYDTDEYLSFDKHFHGFTQLYPVDLASSVTADIVAIGGIDGHAYGSWQGKGPAGRMWLRHFLAKDLPNCRTMIYGYNSKLTVRGIATIEDYSREFLEELKRVRGSDEVRRRPLFFIAHSFGGIILARSLNKALQTREIEDPIIASLHKATYGMFFFAVPHRGLDVEDMTNRMNTEKHPRGALIDQISVDSTHLRLQLQDFIDNLDDRRIVSFYETEQTRRLIKTDNGEWAREGDYFTSLQIESALLHLPARNETKIPLHLNHTMIIKYDSRDTPEYGKVLGYLKEFERDAPPIVQARFVSTLNTPTADRSPSGSRSVVRSSQTIDTNSSAVFDTLLEEAMSKGQNMLDNQQTGIGPDQRLTQAEQHFSQALKLLLEGRASKVTELPRIYNRLTRIRLEETFSKKRSVTQRRVCLQKAYDYNSLAMKVAQQQQNQQHQAEARLRGAVLIGRDAELLPQETAEDRKAVQEMKVEAMCGIVRAMQDLERAGKSELNAELTKWGEGWYSRILRNA